MKKHQLSNVESELITIDPNLYHLSCDENIYQIGCDYLKHIGLISSKEEIIEWYTEFYGSGGYCYPYLFTVFKWINREVLDIIVCDIWSDVTFDDAKKMSNEYEDVYGKVSRCTEFKNHLCEHKTLTIKSSDEANFEDHVWYEKFVFVRILSQKTHDVDLKEWCHLLYENWQLAIWSVKATLKEDEASDKTSNLKNFLTIYGLIG